MPAIRKCCIVGCMSNSRTNPNLQFFQFPRPENPYHKEWKEACHASMSRILPFKKPVLCAAHFLPQHIGGRRLTSNAVPTLNLDVPANLKDVENQAMFVELERSRKHAYINAVVYEWLVRANLNPQLRGSITHGMIKEKAETAKKIIGCDGFVADNRWLNRFRETHLTNFAKKLASNQLKPMGPSLWIPDIVQDLQASFPPTNAERFDNFENVPEQYIDYMKQYGEYDEDDDTDQDQSVSGIKEEDDQDSKTKAQAYYQNFQAGQNYYNSGQQQYNNSFGSEGGAYEDYYNDRQRNGRPSALNEHHHMKNRYSLPNPTNGHANKRRLSGTDTDRNGPLNKRVTPNFGSRSQSPAIVDSNERNAESNNEKSFKIKLPLANGNSRSTSSPTNSQPSTNNNNNSRSNSPKSQNGEITTNGHSSPSPSIGTTVKDLETYEQALEYLKPLEDFALFKENFRAIGLLSQLEAVLRKGKLSTTEETEQIGE
ncbi:uncharacterized protein LOC133338353 [Musca vetustissima]|uniref:uncharacterized protein LOC133338353 n=1 Tax=Musca vetustissima TaxID=27455 RepID=UPI002AB6CF55|nr:uncharacterized protein LOC133338353 [Musca vetustissima]